jgi:hypothetical protein
VEVGVRVADLVIVGVGMPVKITSSTYMVFVPGLSHWNCTDFMMSLSSTASPSPPGEYASTVSADKSRVICCQPAAPVVKPAPLFDHCWPLLSTIFMKNPVAAGA